MSDRELYSVLLTELLLEEITLMSPSSNWSYHLSPIGSCTDEDTLVYHRYYTSDADRERWLADFPDYVMPEKEPLSYNRDARILTLYRRAWPDKLV